MTEQKTESVGYARWIVCALLFGAATINYLDRQIIAIPIDATISASDSIDCNIPVRSCATFTNLD